MAGFEAGVGYEQRMHVPRHLRPWAARYDTYHPVDYTSDEVLTTGVRQKWADPKNPIFVDFARRPSFMTRSLQFDPNTRRPLNPTGRQGIAGRGDLGKWAVNNAADSVTVVGREGRRKILLIEREKSRRWALPGGMIDKGETAIEAAKRELREEAGIDLTAVAGTEVYAGYVDDPRNTDNAWMETNAFLFQIEYDLRPTADSDAHDARWFDLTSVEDLSEQVGGLYASHAQIVAAALAHL